MVLIRGPDRPFGGLELDGTTSLALFYDWRLVRRGATETPKGADGILSEPQWGHIRLEGEAWLGCGTFAWPFHCALLGFDDREQGPVWYLCLYTHSPHATLVPRILQAQDYVSSSRVCPVQCT